MAEVTSACFFTCASGKRLTREYTGTVIGLDVTEVVDETADLMEL